MSYGERKEEELAEHTYMRRHLKVHCQIMNGSPYGAAGHDPNNVCARR
jgi:hypothetical protein